jgi:hypothetical protein
VLGVELVEQSLERLGIGLGGGGGGDVERTVLVRDLQPGQELAAEDRG